MTAPSVQYGPTDKLDYVGDSIIFDSESHSISFIIGTGDFVSCELTGDTVPGMEFVQWGSGFFPPSSLFGFRGTVGDIGQKIKTYNMEVTFTTTVGSVSYSWDWVISRVESSYLQTQYIGIHGDQVGPGWFILFKGKDHGGSGSLERTIIIYEEVPKKVVKKVIKRVKKARKEIKSKDVSKETIEKIVNSIVRELPKAEIEQKMALYSLSYDIAVLSYTNTLKLLIDDEEAIVIILASI